MDTRLKSITFFILLLASLFCSMLSASEARPRLHYPSSPSKGIVGDVNGIFRTLKGSVPRPGQGHRLKRLQNLGQIKNSGPSPGEGHRVKSLQDVPVTDHSGPSPGGGHKAIINLKHF
ncbi:hypothetical protein L6164_033619 [Bauhinia variegata]|uniref:Uncharacterized protein n=1 Tax=Bauhinia variegata TaxID=167791 RepID=A0ACB9KSA7_BAUVA|nr:hypothetical protein L6164_033619 [Bauhinia variegata]